MPSVWKLALERAAVHGVAFLALARVGRGRGRDAVRRHLRGYNRPTLPTQAGNPHVRHRRLPRQAPRRRTGPLGPDPAGHAPGPRLPRPRLGRRRPVRPRHPTGTCAQRHRRPATRTIDTRRSRRPCDDLGLTVLRHYGNGVYDASLRLHRADPARAGSERCRHSCPARKSSAWASSWTSSSRSARPPQLEADLRHQPLDRHARHRPHAPVHREPGRSEPLAAVLGARRAGPGDGPQRPRHQLPQAAPPVRAARPPLLHRERLRGDRRLPARPPGSGPVAGRRPALVAGRL